MVFTPGLSQKLRNLGKLRGRLSCQGASGDLGKTVPPPEPLQHVLTCAPVCPSHAHSVLPELQTSAPAQRVLGWLLPGRSVHS